jgi:hypothetical protein
MKQVQNKVDWLDTTAGTASENSTWWTVDEFDELLVFVRVTDIPVTGTFDAKVQTKDPDGNAVDLTSAAITQVTDTTINTYIAALVFGSQVRVAITIGSGTYTYKVHAQAKGVK